MPLKFANNQSLTSTTALPSAVPTDNLILISTQTASNSSSVSFTSGLDSTYDMYEFKFINVVPTVDENGFEFQGSTNGGSTYGVTMTSTFFQAYHTESDSTTALNYSTGGDLAQSTGFQILLTGVGNGADESCVASMSLFNPSSTTYVKHFISSGNIYDASDFSVNYFVAGYGNTTSAVNAIQFKMSSGNFDGTIAMFGVL